MFPWPSIKIMSNGHFLRKTTICGNRSRKIHQEPMLSWPSSLSPHNSQSLPFLQPLANKSTNSSPETKPSQTSTRNKRKNHTTTTIWQESSLFLQNSTPKQSTSKVWTKFWRRSSTSSMLTTPKDQFRKPPASSCSIMLWATSSISTSPISEIKLRIPFTAESEEFLPCFSYFMFYLGPSTKNLAKTWWMEDRPIFLQFQMDNPPVLPIILDVLNPKTLVKHIFPQRSLRPHKFHRPISPSLIFQQNHIRIIRLSNAPPKIHRPKHKYRQNNKTS